MVEDDARRAAERVDGLAVDVVEVELALLEVAGAEVEAEERERIPTEAAEDAVVGLRDAGGLDVVVAAGVQDLRRLRRWTPS